jgi:hypothetical protein
MEEGETFCIRQWKKCVNENVVHIGFLSQYMEYNMHINKRLI